MDQILTFSSLIKKVSNHKLIQPSFLTHQGTITSGNPIQIQSDPSNAFKPSQQVYLSTKEESDPPDQLGVGYMSISDPPDDL